MTSSTSHRDRIDLLQAGRAVAALAVVLFHVDTIATAYGAQPILGGVFALGERGVDFFFVLSGFIIVYAHQNDQQGLISLKRYATRRIVRLYPVLWLVAGSVLLLNFFLDGEMPSFEKILTSMTLLPSITWPSPAVSWTLRHEILFYALFATLFVNRRLGSFILVGWFLACLIQSMAIVQGGGVGGVGALILSPLNLDFAFGIAAALLAARTSQATTPIRLLAIACIVVFIVFALFLVFDGAPRTVLAYQDAAALPWDIAFGIVFGFLVFALVKADNVITTPPVLIFVGAASYAIYLVHTSVMGLGARFIAPPPLQLALWVQS